MLASPDEHANEVLEYLVQTCPGAIEKKSTDGETPLMVACQLGRTDFVKILIQGNANQSVRNNKGENIIHMALSKNTVAPKLRKLLDLLDSELRTHLFTQRKNLSENGTAPLHAWVSRFTGADRNFNYGWYNRDSTHLNESETVALVQLLLEYSDGQGLDMLNGAGDTCLHTAIMKNSVAITKVLLDFKPDLLYRENAVGRTPAEAAYDIVTSSQLSKPQESQNHELMFATRVDQESRRIEKLPEPIEAQSTAEAKAKAKLIELGLSGDHKADLIPSIQVSAGVIDDCRIQRLDGKISQQIIWDLCATAMEKNPGPRRLVSLNEANDVARRLGEQQVQSRYFSVNKRDNEDDEDAEDADSKLKDDFSVIQLRSNLGHAWKSPEELKNLKACPACNICHATS